jgi:hypothetical protein
MALGELSPADVLIRPEEARVEGESLAKPEGLRRRLGVPRGTLF